MTYFSETRPQYCQVALLSRYSPRNRARSQLINKLALVTMSMMFAISQASTAQPLVQSSAQEYKQADKQTSTAAQWLPNIISYLLGEPEIPEICTQSNSSGIEIIDLNHPVGLSQLPFMCDAENVDSCVRRAIARALPLGCRGNIDVFIPGSGQEEGDYKQFRSLIDKTDNRGTLSIGYSAGDATDAINYDRGTRKSRDVLAIVLRVLKERFEPDSVRIYGHSKGSHGVALEADRKLGVAGYENFHFFAFGQAGRTAVKIDDTSDMVKARLGTRGYIERLSANLVGITWENDEVRDYKGSGFNGLKMPLSLRYMGHVYGDDTLGSGLPLYTRFDHHNTYGGGFTESAVPYCYTGSGFVMGLNANNRCIKKQSTLFPAYFWGNTNCREVSHAMLEDPSSNGKRWIGTPGPRVSDANCAPREGTVRASYSLGYRHNQSDKDCHLKLSIAALGLNSPGSDDNRPNGTSLTIVQDGDIALIGGAKRKTGYITLPYNMTLRIDAGLIREPGVGNCGGPLETETYIDYFEVSFTHPVTQQTGYKRYLIGNAETAAYPGQIAHNKAKSPWVRTSGEWDLKFDAIYTALKIEGNTYASSETASNLVSKIRLTKEVSLID